MRDYCSGVLNCKKIALRQAVEAFGDESRWREMMSDLPGGSAPSSADMANAIVFPGQSKGPLYQWHRHYNRRRVER